MSKLLSSRKILTEAKVSNLLPNNYKKKSEHFPGTLSEQFTNPGLIN